MLISSILLISFTFIFYKLFLKNPEIKWQFKIVDFIFTLVSKYYTKLKSKNFNRERFKKIENLISPKKFATNKKFIKGILIEDLLIKSQWKDDPYSNKNIPIKIFVPEISTKNSEKKLPIMVNIHGGGFVLEFNNDKSINLAKENMIVISVQYRLAPEHRYPTALEDCYSVFDYIGKKQNEILNKFADYEKISVIGDSAGGNLSALIPFLIRDRKLNVKLSHQILIYPTMMIDLKKETESKKNLKGKDYILSNELMEWFIKEYLNLNADNGINDDNDKRKYEVFEEGNVSPLNQKDFTGLPPALIILATQDILYSDGIIYADLLSKNKIRNEVVEYKSVHGFYAIEGLAEEREAHKCIIEYLKKNKFID